jgi:hypothetical protein
MTPLMWVQPQQQQVLLLPQQAYVLLLPLL